MLEKFLSIMAYVHTMLKYIEHIIRSLLNSKYKFLVICIGVILVLAFIYFMVHQRRKVSIYNTLQTCHFDSWELEPDSFLLNRHFFYQISSSMILFTKYNVQFTRANRYPLLSEKDSVYYTKDNPFLINSKKIKKSEFIKGAIFENYKGRWHIISTYPDSIELDIPGSMFKGRYAFSRGEETYYDNNEPTLYDAVYLRNDSTFLKLTKIRHRPIFGVVFSLDSTHKKTKD